MNSQHEPIAAKFMSPGMIVSQSEQFDQVCNSVSRSDTDTVLVTGGRFSDSVIVHTHTGKVFQNGGEGYRRFFALHPWGFKHT